MVQLHVATAALCVATTQVALAGLLVAYARLQKTYPGMQHWAAGAFACGGGFLAVALRPAAPTASVVLTNLLLAAWLFLALDGTLRFVEGERLSPRWYLLPGVLAAAQFYFAAVVPSLMVRQWLLLLVAGAALGSTGGVLLRGAPLEARPLYRAFAAVQFLLLTTFMVRTIAMELGPTPPDILQAGPREVLFFLLVSAWNLTGLAGYLLLNGQRQESELLASQNLLLETLDNLTVNKARLKVLAEMLHLCPRCKQIRDEEGRWKPVERYVSQHSEATFSHGLCPQCARLLYGEFADPLEGEEEG